MSRVDATELVGGLFLVSTGAALAGYAAVHYPVGTVLRMGPGMLPVSLGVLLAVFGLIIAASAFFRSGEHTDVQVQVPLVILASVLAFALLIGTAGLLPAIAGCAIIATVAERPFRPAFSLVLAAALCVLAWLVFVVALRLPIPLLRWPF
jgi:hypothetical protein